MQRAKGWRKKQGKVPKQKLRLVVADVDLVNGRINLEWELRMGKGLIGKGNRNSCGNGRSTLPASY